jgi:uncharacterized tellurite resistance protein B-like protein
VSPATKRRKRVFGARSRREILPLFTAVLVLILTGWGFFTSSPWPWMVLLLCTVTTGLWIFRRQVHRLHRALVRSKRYLDKLAPVWKIVRGDRRTITDFAPGEKLKWQSLAAEISGSDIVLRDVSQLATIRGLASRPKLTPKQSDQLAQAAHDVGLSIEPDYRDSHRVYVWDDPVALFRPATSPKDGRYAGASLLLGIGLYVASADGEVHAGEIDRVTHFLEGQFRLDPVDRRRLEALSRVLCLRRPTIAGLGKRVQAHLPVSAREEIGPILVHVAARDGAVSRKELASLRSAYKALGLDPASLERLLNDVRASALPAALASLPGPVATAPSVAKPVPALLLNEARLQQILSETHDVARLLGEAMQDSEDEPDLVEPVSDSSSQIPALGVPVPPTIHSQFDGLEPRYHTALASLLARPSWPKTEFDDLARHHGLMPSSLFDVLNEWAQERLGDLIIEDRGGEMRMQGGMIPVSK